MESVTSITDSISISNRSRRNPALEIPPEVQFLILDELQESKEASIPSQQANFCLISRNYYDLAMQLLYKLPLSSSDCTSTTYHSNLSILVETLKVNKNLALYVRHLHFDKFVPGTIEAWKKCSGLTRLTVGFEVIKQLELPGKADPMFKKLKILSISGKACDYKTVMAFIQSIVGNTLWYLHLPGISVSSDLPSVPSLPLRYTTLTSFDTRLSAMLPFFPIQSYYLRKLHVRFNESINSFEFLKPFSHLQFFKIFGNWRWVGNKDRAYDLLGYFPDLLEIESQHPEPISIETFKLLLNTSPNLTKLDLRETRWVDHPAEKLCNELSNILKGKSLEIVQLGYFMYDDEEIEVFVTLRRELLGKNCVLTWKGASGGGPDIFDFDLHLDYLFG